MNPQLLKALEQAGLTGRGGAAFATHRKLELALRHDAALIVNACDGELGAAKDAAIVERHLDELIHGAGLVHPHPVYAAHRGSSSAERLKAAGLQVLEAPARYVSSEETSLISLLHGGLARPLVKWRPAAAGAIRSTGGSLPPTLVLNAETVLRISQIERAGPAWFRSFGTPDEPGPRFVTVDGSVLHPGVFEASAGQSLSSAMSSAGAFDVQAINVGGLSGSWLSPDEAAVTRWSSSELHKYGASVGSGVVHVLGGPRCPWQRVAEVLTYAAGESAGQCGPCMFGVPAVAEDVRRIVDGRGGPHDVERLRSRVGLLPGRGACRFPDGVASYVRGALRVFDTDLATHVGSGGCIDERSSHALAST